MESIENCLKSKRSTSKVKFYLNCGETSGLAVVLSNHAIFKRDECDNTHVYESNEEFYGNSFNFNKETGWEQET